MLLKILLNLLNVNSLSINNNTTQKACVVQLVQLAPVILLSQCHSILFTFKAPAPIKLLSLIPSTLKQNIDYKEANIDMLIRKSSYKDICDIVTDSEGNES